MADNQVWEVHSGLTSELIEQRITQNYSAVIQSLAVSELRVFLVENGQITLQEAEKITSAKSLLDKVAEGARQGVGSDAYVLLYEGISKLDAHMGHGYLKALLEGKEYATAEAVKQSNKIKSNVRQNLSRLVDCDIPALTVRMVSCELLTYDEKRQLTAAFDTGQIDRKTFLLRLFNLLDTKGPIAYNLFAECLHQESEHITHAELYDLIQPPPGRSICQPTHGLVLHNHKLHGCLRGREYDKLMRKFQSYHHNGKWAELEAETMKLSSDDTPCELRVVALLESAVSWIFRREAAKVVKLVEQAKALLPKVQGNNRILLKGRSEYILSRLYRYLKQYKEAQAHIEKAVYILAYAERGEDSAFVHYCDACIMVEQLSENSTTEEIEEAKQRYEHAIFDARSHGSGLDLVAPHSFMRLAQMYLGSTHYTTGSKHDPESLRSASNCLSQVNVDSLAQRSKCHFFFIQSDLQRNQGDRRGATESARLAMEVAREHSFTLEVSSAKDRLDTLVEST